MNGAKPVPDRIMRIPNNRRMRMMGNNHHFLF
jgi:hypothetical protein